MSNGNKPNNLAFGNITIDGQMTVYGFNVMRGNYGNFISFPSKKIGEGPEGNIYKQLFSIDDKDALNEFKSEFMKVFKEAEASPDKKAEKVCEVKTPSYRVGINKIEGNSKLKANASISFDNIYRVDMIEVKYKADEDRNYVIFPGFVNAKGEYEEMVRPANKEFRDEVKANILECMRQAEEMSKGTTI